MNDTFNARSIFKNLGASEVSIRLASQWAWHKPITSEPGATTTKTAVSLIQKGLQGVGCAVKVTGKLDPLTAQCLQDISGPDWKHMTWLEHGKKLVSMRNRGLKAPQNKTPLEGLGAVGAGSQLGGLLLVGGVLFLALKFKK